MLKVALPKGRVFSEILLKLSARGISFPEIENSKALSVQSSDGRYEALSVRSADVPTYVTHGAADLGIVGKDVLWEFDDDDELYELLDLDLGRCRLVAASPGGVIPKAAVWRVATKYPVSTQRAFQKRGRPVEIIKLYGSVELAPAAGIADIVVDLVETGGTLAANGLEVIDELGESSLRLIANRVAWKIKGESAREFLELLK